MKLEAVAKDKLDPRVQPFRDKVQKAVSAGTLDEQFGAELVACLDSIAKSGQPAAPKAPGAE